MALVDMLYVEDDEDLTNNIVGLIKPTFSNLNIKIAHTNEEAWNCATTGHYDLVLYDLGNDENENYPFARKLRDQLSGAIMIGISLAGSRFRRYPTDIFHEFINSLTLADGWREVPEYATFMNTCKKYGIILEPRKD